MRTPQKAALLVLGSEDNGIFRETLRELQFEPIFLDSMDAMLHALRHTRAVAVLVDRDGNETDDLELVLNIRDLDEKIPIFLIGSHAHWPTEAFLREQPATFVIRRRASDTSLGRRLRSFTKAGAHGS